MAWRDPIQRSADGSRDLYDVASWDARSLLDRTAVVVYRLLQRGSRAAVIVLALAILAAQLAFGGLLVSVGNPVVGGYVLLSVLPALAVAAYVWRADVTMGEPLVLLIATFLLGFLFAGFAAVLNTTLGAVFDFAGLPVVLFFFLVVGPVEESVKLLAVRLYAYRSSAFDAVIDGAVYGAMAGLGFATIENAVYITDQYLAASAAGIDGALSRTFETAAVRLFAGPGHVLYSALAGYYLGLAKFNPNNRGPIIIKGLLLATIVHAAYNSLVTNLGMVADLALFAGVGTGQLFIGFVIVYDGLIGYVLYRKLSRYRRTFFAVGADDDAVIGDVERDEFEWDRSETIPDPTGTVDRETVRGDAGAESTADAADSEGAETLSDPDEVERATGGETGIDEFDWGTDDGD